MSVASLASYAYGQCTYYVASVLSWIPAGLGNAVDWIDNAQAKGLPTSDTPQAGAVVVYKGGSFAATSDTPAGWYSSLGHVAVVTRVNADGTFEVSEANYGGSTVAKPDSRASTMADVEGFILPPNGTNDGAALATIASNQKQGGTGNNGGAGAGGPGSLLDGLAQFGLTFFTGTGKGSELQSEQSTLTQAEKDAAAVAGAWMTFLQRMLLVAFLAIVAIVLFYVLLTKSGVIAPAPVPVPV